MVVRRLPPDELYHHGIKGQKWGIRRYQNKDGSLTAEGREHYGKTYSNRTVGSSDGNFTIPKGWKKSKYQLYEDKLDIEKEKRVETSTGSKTDVIFSVDQCENQQNLEKCIKISDNLEKSFKTIDKNFRKVIAEKYYDDFNFHQEWLEDKVSREDFIKSLGNDYLQIAITDFGEKNPLALALYDDGVIDTGHTFEIEFDPKSGKIHYVSMQG